MTALPAALGRGEDLVVWRLEERTYAATWDSGEGPFLYGGRWNSKGVRVVYCALDPAVAILEVAVHKGSERSTPCPTCSRRQGLRMLQRSKSS